MMYTLQIIVTQDTTSTNSKHYVVIFSYETQKSTVVLLCCNEITSTLNVLCIDVNVLTNL